MCGVIHVLLSYSMRFHNCVLVLFVWFLATCRVCCMLFYSRLFCLIKSNFVYSVNGEQQLIGGKR